MSYLGAINKNDKYTLKNNSSAKVEAYGDGSNSRPRKVVELRPFSHQLWKISKTTLLVNRFYKRNINKQFGYINNIGFIKQRKVAFK